MMKRALSLFLSLLMLLSLCPLSALADDGAATEPEQAAASASESSTEKKAETSSEKTDAGKTDETSSEKTDAGKTTETSSEKTDADKTADTSSEKTEGADADEPEEVKYTVKFVAYGKVVARKTVKAGKTVSSLPQVKLEDESHVFEGWFYKENKKVIKFTTSTVVSRNITVTAKINKGSDDGEDEILEDLIDDDEADQGSDLIKADVGSGEKTANPEETKDPEDVKDPSALGSDDDNGPRGGGRAVA